VIGNPGGCLRGAARARAPTGSMDFCRSTLLFQSKPSPGMLALSIGFWLDLPKPYWALRVISFQPSRGATRSKAVYSRIGTLVGSAAAVALVPISSMLPLCLSRRFRFGPVCVFICRCSTHPRSYVFMLAGYTTAIVGFPASAAPDTIFDLALARTEEILVASPAPRWLNSCSHRSGGPGLRERMRMVAPRRGEQYATPLDFRQERPRIRPGSFAAMS